MDALILTLQFGGTAMHLDEAGPLLPYEKGTYKSQPVRVIYIKTGKKVADITHRKATVMALRTVRVLTLLGKT